MAIRLRYRVETSVSSSQADLKDLGNVCVDVLTDSPSEGGIWKTRVLKTATVTLPLDSISAAVFLMLRVVAADPTEVLKPVTVTLNGTATFTLAPVAGAKEANFLLSTADLSSLQIANTAVDAVDVDITIGTSGD